MPPHSQMLLWAAHCCANAKLTNGTGQNVWQESKAHANSSVDPQRVTFVSKCAGCIRIAARLSRQFERLETIASWCVESIVLYTKLVPGKLPRAGC